MLMDMFGIRWQLLLLLSLLCGFCGVKNVCCEIEYNTINEDGSYSFRHSNDDIGAYYHSATGTPDNIVRGRYGSRNPASGQVEEVVYSAGPRGFRVNGPKIHRKMDLAQFPIRPIGSPDDPLADPYDDPTYSFSYRTPDQSRSEDNDATGRVRGLYSYIDDVGERHTVRYAAGAGTGFEVANAVPDNPAIVGYTAPLYKAPARTRGKMSVQRGPLGSYKLIAAGPDHRRAESRGSDGLVKGTYSYLDDKGIQRTVEYIAGAGIGYRVVQNRVGPGTHINPSIAEFRLSDTDFKLANDFGRGAGGGLGPSGGSGPARGGKGPGAADGTDYLKTEGSNKVRPKGGDSSGSDLDDIEDGEDVDTEDEAHKRKQGEGADSSRVKADRMGAASANNGGKRYRGDERSSSSGADISSEDDNLGGGRGKAKSSDRRVNGRPSSNRNTINSEERMRNRNRNGNRNRGTNNRGGSKTTTLSMTSSDSGYSYDAPSASASSSSNNYNFNDDDVGSLPPLITANRKILEIDRERDWVARNRDSTVIKNVGKWYIGLPPGQSVRAHVQNIDVLPLGGRSVLSPSEALRQDEIADMVASLENSSGATAFRSS